MGFIYGIKYCFSKNLPKTYFPTSWLRQSSGLQEAEAEAAKAAEMEVELCCPCPPTGHYPQNAILMVLGLPKRYAIKVV